MPSSAPTVSKRAGRAAQGRPEAWEFEGPRLLPAARAVKASGHVRRHPAVSSHGLPTQAGRGGRRGSGTVAPVFTGYRPGLASQGHGPRVRSLRSCDPSPRSASRWLFRPAGCLRSPALPAAIWECREEETWLPPGDNARENLGSTSRRGRDPGQSTFTPPPARLASDPTRRPSGSGSTSLTTSLHFRPLPH